MVYVVNILFVKNKKGHRPMWHSYIFLLQIKKMQHSRVTYKYIDMTMVAQTYIY